MKTTAALLFALTAGLTVSASAIADQFNNRGPEFNVGVSSSPPSSAAVASNNGFTKRGADFVAGVSSEADAPRESGRFVSSYGFVKGNQI